MSVGFLVYLGQREARLGELFYSGTIEATEANLAFQAGGRVVRVIVREGQAVVKGQVLAELDRAEYEARFEQAMANVARYRELQKQLQTLLEVYEKSLPLEVDRAEAGVRALSSQLEELLSGNRAQDVEGARQAFLKAEAVMEEARKNRDRYDQLFNMEIASEKEWDAERLKYETALRDYEQRREAYDLAKEGPRREAIETARARLSEGKAALNNARNDLKRIEAARRDVESARQQVRAGEAALAQAKIQVEYTELKAPFPGIITSRNVEPGEVVTPSREVITLADLSRVDLKIFVGETEIGKVKQGQSVDVKVDTFPDKVYKGVVTFISPEGEFTPKIIQTHKERVKLVYLVKISLPNPDLELKTGMPADAWLR
ncbi:MAG TPA: HlyD family efflux transporter periplasmic adaptor subunit [Syntrophales bacterium]|nr:HlyD family efflux transporter periplasmic adaptor subunit [Syntrophales bacterium]